METVIVKWPAVYATALVSGLASAVAELVVVLPIQAMLGSPPTVLFQSITYGLLGMATFRFAALFRRRFLSGEPLWRGLLSRVAPFFVMPMSAIGIALRMIAFGLPLAWVSSATFGLIEMRTSTTDNFSRPVSGHASRRRP